MATGMDSASKTGYDTAELKSCPIALITVGRILLDHCNGITDNPLMA